MSTLLLVDPGPPSKSGVLRQLLKTGDPIYFACGPRSNWMQELVDSRYLILTDTSNLVRLVNDVVAFQFVHNLRFGAVGTFEEIALCQTAVLSNALGITHQSFAGIWQSSRSKIAMRQKLAECRLSAPSFEVVEHSSQLYDRVASYHFPCVIKPAYGESSLGVGIIESQAQLATIDSILKTRNASNYPELPHLSERPFLIEEFCDGSIVSIDGIIQRGQFLMVGATETEVESGAYPVLRANYIPPRLPYSLVQECEKMVQKAVSCLGFDECGFHCEFRCTPQGPKIIEIAARMPGGQIPKGYEIAYGINFPALMHDLWLGRDIVFSKEKNQYIAQRGVFPQTSGTLSRIWETLTRNRPCWLHSFEIVTPAGSIINLEDHPRKPFYYFVVVGESIDDIEKKERLVQSQVHIIMQP